MAVRKTKDYTGIIFVRGEDGSVSSKDSVIIKAKDTTDARKQMEKKYGSETSDDTGLLAWTVGVAVSSF